jgi:Protein of unknown function (DUF2589)
MADNSQIEPAAEFQKLPLELVVGSALTAVAKAQAMTSQATLNFILGLCDGPGSDPNGPRTPKTIDLSVERQNTNAGGGAGGLEKTTIKAPLLAIVPIPHLLVDSVTINFKYEVSQTFCDKSQTSGSLDLEAGTTGVLGSFVKATLHGNLAHSSSSEATTNRGGTLDIMIRASQSPIPAGLDRLITMLSQAITPAPKT